MKKEVLFIMLLFLGLGTTAQHLNIDLDNFTEVEIANALKVNFKKAEENSVVITGKSKGKVRVNIDKGILNISLRGYRLVKDDSTAVTIYYKKLDKVIAKQNSRVKFYDEVKQDSMELCLQEGSDLIISLEVEDLFVRIATSANLIISGKAENQEIEVQSEGRFSGQNLIGETVNINIGTKGIASIFVRDTLKASASAGGTLFVYGNPKQMDEKTTLGGSIKKLN